MNDGELALPDEKHRDPVCGMRVGENDPSLEHEGETYYFCSAICRKQFERDPDLYRGDSGNSRSTFQQARRDFIVGLLIALGSNFVGVLALAVYLSLVFSWQQVMLFRSTALTITGLSIVAGVSIALWITRPLLGFFLPFGNENGSHPDRSVLQKTALNFPMTVALIILAGWLVFGSIGAAGAYLGGAATYLDWFLHIFLGNFYSGCVVAISTFYVTEALFSRNVLPFLMGNDNVSSLDGIMEVPTWLRITILVVTTAIFPMIHILGLHYLNDATSDVLVFFIGGIILVALLQGFYILRSISVPIGQIAGEFERFQTGRPLKQNLDIYRADDLGRFSEMFENLVSTIHERDFLQRTFGRYMSQQVLDEIMDGQVELGGERQRATVLFADIRNFTRLTERMQPEEVVRLLNDYFEHMVQGITDYNGIPDKFLGDGILAVWGVPVDSQDHQSNGVRGGLAMLENLKTFNEKRREMDRPVLTIGTSVHTGELIAGNIGSRQKMEYTVVGDTVNTCSRMESLNKELNSVMTISEAVYSQLDPPLKNYFDRAGQVQPRGKDEEISIYTLTERNGLSETMRAK